MIQERAFITYLMTSEWVDNGDDGDGYYPEGWYWNLAGDHPYAHGPFDSEAAAQADAEGSTP